MQKHTGTVQDSYGNALSGASVQITTYPADVNATLYSDNGVTPISNPVTSDQYGKYTFYAANGRCSTRTSGVGILGTIFEPDSILLEDPADPSPGVFTTLTGTSVLRGTSQLPYVLAQTAIPVIMVPNGIVATDGTITLGTALPAIYANAWIRLPAGAVSGGAAGVYYCVFSSTTVGQVYTNFVDPSTTAFIPSVPTSPVAATGSNAAYTQTTGSDILLVNITVLGGSMGPNGVIREEAAYSLTNNANNKVIRSQFGGGNVSAVTASSNATWTFCKSIRNRGVQNKNTWTSQSVSSDTVGALAGNLMEYVSIDTSINQSLTFTAFIATATDYIVLEGFTIEVLHKP